MVSLHAALLFAEQKIHEERKRRDAAALNDQPTGPGGDADVLIDGGWHHGASAISPRRRAAAVAMTRERETELMDWKDRLLDAVHRVDQLLCGDEDDDDLDVDDLLDDLDDDLGEEADRDSIVDPEDAVVKERVNRPIQYDLRPRRRDVALKGNLR
jgi:hypothetical protein